MFANSRYDLLGKHQDAVLHFELSLDEYQTESPANFMMISDVATRTGSLYSYLGQSLKAARAYNVASSAFKESTDTINQCVYMCHQSSCMLIACQNAEAVKIADECMVRCQDCEHSDTLGTIFIV